MAMTAFGYHWLQLAFAKNKKLHNWKTEPSLLTVKKVWILPIILLRNLFLKKIPKIRS